MSAHTLKEMAAMFGAAPDLYELVKDVVVSEMSDGLYVTINMQPLGFFSMKVAPEFTELALMWRRKQRAAIAKAEGQS